MIIQIILLIFGMGLLIKGADWMVEGSSSVAKKLKVSDLVIGLTIVAFGTSAPELVVSLISAFNGSTDIAISNVLGSNIANILLILGLSGIITNLKVQKDTVWKEIPMALLAMILLFIFANDLLVDDIGINQISRSDGISLLSMFIVFLYYTFGIAKKEQEKVESESNNIKTIKTSIAVALVIVGITGLIIGGRLVVSNAVSLATSFGMSEALIGFTIIAIGTSLPELVTSVVASMKGKTDIAIGNAIGSNIFNVFWILGITSLITPVPYNPNLNIDMLVGIGASLFVFLALFVGKKHKFERWQGVIAIITYITYMVFLIIRG